MIFMILLLFKWFSWMLWKMYLELIVVFLEGVGVILYMCLGINEIGEKMVVKMVDYWVVVWLYYGVFVVGDFLDEIYGLVEIVEKLVLIYMMICE